VHAARNGFCIILAATLSGKSQPRKNCAVVLLHLVSGDPCGSFRPFAGNLAQLPRNQRRNWHRPTAERSQWGFSAIRPLANLAAVSDAILCFQLLSAHQGSKLHINISVKARGTVLLRRNLRSFHTACPCSKADARWLNRERIGHGAEIGAGGGAMSGTGTSMGAERNFGSNKSPRPGSGLIGPRMQPNPTTNRK
jgi:hypothetical protein